MTEENNWCKELGIVSECSSAFNPSSNGFSENKVAITKRTLIKMMEEGTITSVSDNMQLSKAMCHLMQTPRVKGLSAADLFFGRKVRSPLLPTLIDIGQCRITDQQWADVCEFKEHSRKKSMMQGPKGRKSRVQMAFKNDFILETDNTAELKIGDSCLVYDTARAMWTREAVVTEIRPSGRSYWVEEISTGRKLLRSRRHLRRKKGAADEALGKEHAKKVVLRRERSSRDSTCQSSSPSSSQRPTIARTRPASPSTPATAPPHKKVRFALGTKRQ